MKKLFLIIYAVIFLVIGNAAQALTFNVVVLPADLLNVCNNFYCYPEVSEIIANDLISYFNNTDKVNSPSVVEVRRKLAENTAMRSSLQNALTAFRNNGNINFQVYKNVADIFNAKSVLLVSNTVPVENAYVKRNVWEILELSTMLDFSYPYVMETNAVLLDTYNDLVMWSGNYNKKISDSSGNFSAPKSSQSYSKYGFLQFYSKDILSKTIAENVILRFFPKTINPVVNTENVKPTGEYLRYESGNPSVKRPQRKELNPDEFGELLFDI